MEPIKELMSENSDELQSLNTQKTIYSEHSQKVDTELKVFEPDYSTKKLWLSTRKDPYDSPGIYLPGFYKTSDVRIDKIFFYIALAMEIIAFYIILSGGLGSSDPTNKLKAIASALGFVFLDGFGAFFIHKMKGNICLQENKIQAETDPKKIDAYEIDKKIGWYYRYIGITLVIASSMLKILGTIIFGHVSSLILTIILILLYVFVIYIHINHTGFWVSNCLHRNRYNNQYSKYAKDKQKARASSFDGRELIQPIISPFSIFVNKSMTRQIVGNHELIYVEEKNGKFYYNLKTKGILEDSEIFTFLNALKPKAKPILAKNCLYHQVFNIHVDTKSLLSKN